MPIALYMDQHVPRAIRCRAMLFADEARRRQVVAREERGAVRQHPI